MLNFNSWSFSQVQLKFIYNEFNLDFEACDYLPEDAILILTSSTHVKVINIHKQKSQVIPQTDCGEFKFRIYSGDLNSKNAHIIFCNKNTLICLSVNIEAIEYSKFIVLH